MLRQLKGSDRIKTCKELFMLWKNHKENEKKKGDDSMKY